MCCHILWVWAMVCVGVCTYVYMYISHSRPVMLLFGGKATSTIKVGSKIACGFLECWAGVGSLGKTQKETLSLLYTYRYMYLNALHRPWPAFGFRYVCWAQGWLYQIYPWDPCQAHLTVKYMRYKTWLEAIFSWNTKIYEHLLKSITI